MVGRLEPQSVVVQAEEELLELCGGNLQQVDVRTIVMIVIRATVTVLHAQ